MAHDLDVRHFFQRAPKPWLRRYFDQAGVLANVDWRFRRSTECSASDGRAWLDLEADLQGQFAEDFGNIKLLATPVGKVQIIDEARHYGRDQEVAAKLAEFNDYYDCAFWVLLEEHAYWNGAIFYAAADSKPKRYWRKRIDLPRLGRRPTQADGDALAEAVAALFRRKEGRGGHCVVHQYRRGQRGELEYYFAYPARSPAHCHRISAGQVHQTATCACLRDCLCP